MSSLRPPYHIRTRSYGFVRLQMWPLRETPMRNSNLVQVSAELEIWPNAAALGAPGHNTTAKSANAGTTNKANNMKSHRIMSGRQIRLLRFRSPLNGTVLAATASCYAVETLSTPLGTLVTAIDQFSADKYGGLRYRVNAFLPSIPADRCKCKAGDLISWYMGTN